MTVQALGYVGVRAKSLEDWAAYGQNFLGLQGHCFTFDYGAHAGEEFAGDGEGLKVFGHGVHGGV